MRSIYHPQIFENTTWVENEFIFKMIPFSLGREALRVLFLELAEKKGSVLKILIPEFICQEVIDALKGLSLIITWYPVDVLNLDQVLVNEEDLKTHDCLLLVNYFGRASSFKTDKNILVIEDNAHGFLGEDLLLKKLGTRFDFGIFSMHKSLPIQKGAGLYYSSNHQALGEKINQKQQNKNRYDELISKSKLRKLSQYFPLVFFHYGLKMKRAIFLKMKKESNINADAANIVCFPFELIKRLNIKKEKARRLKLYQECLNFMNEYQGVIKILPFNPGEIPYGFVFLLMDLTKEKSLKLAAGKKGIDLVNWPNLPVEIIEKYPYDHHYKNVYFIPFIW